MKLSLNKNNFTNPNYQKVATFNANNVMKPRDILDLELVDEETQKVFTLKTLLENYDKCIKGLIQTNEDLSLELENRTKRLLEIIIALKQEVREEGVI